DRANDLRGKSSIGAPAMARADVGATLIAPPPAASTRGTWDGKSPRRGQEEIGMSCCRLRRGRRGFVELSGTEPGGACRDAADHPVVVALRNDAGSPTLRSRIGPAIRGLQRHAGHVRRDLEAADLGDHLPRDGADIVASHGRYLR